MKKECRICKVEKEVSLDNFHKHGKNKDGFWNICKPCRKEIDKKYYRLSPNKKETSKNRSNWIKSCIDNIKVKSGCINCYENSKWCLDFHHIESNEKEKNISKYANIPLEKLILEMNKCCILCSNCHRKYHGGVLKIEKFERLNISKDIHFKSDIYGKNNIGVKNFDKVKRRKSLGLY